MNPENLRGMVHYAVYTPGDYVESRRGYYFVATDLISNRDVNRASLISPWLKNQRDIGLYMREVEKEHETAGTPDRGYRNRLSHGD